MHLFYWRHPEGIPNFGDELNPWLFPRLAPELFESDDGMAVAAIGTIFNDQLWPKIEREYPQVGKIVVFGSGVGHYGGAPELDGRWRVYCVRGPRSAAALELPPSAWITDPGCLAVRGLEPGPEKVRFSLMPHLLSVNPTWQRIAESVGFGFIDPRWPVSRVLAAIRSTGTLLTEAMHGAVVADALGVPWIHVTMSPPSAESGWREYKWTDWCESIGVAHRAHEVPRAYPEPNHPLGAWPRARREAKIQLIRLRLVQVSRTARPSLSSRHLLAARVEALEERLQRLRDDYRAGLV